MKIDQPLWKKNIARDLAVFAGLFVVAFLAKMEAINAIIAIWIGIWAMVKLFKPFFEAGEDSRNLSAGDFIPNFWNITSNLLYSDKRKSTFLILMWWVLGIGIMAATYKVLTALFISP